MVRSGRFIPTLFVSVWLVALLVSSWAHGADQTKKEESKKTRRFAGEIVVTATGEPTPARDVPAAATVFDRQSIDDAGAETASELLRRVPGVMVSRAGEEGAVTSVFTRGTNSNHTLVLFDGVRLNSPYFGGYDFSQIPTVGLERLEVVRGPFSALWGADAVGGVVNVIPARGRRGVQATLVTEGGGGSWARVEGTVAWGQEGVDLLLSGFHREGKGELSNSGFETDQWMLDLGYSWGKGNRLAFVGQNLAADLEIPFSGAMLTPHRRQSSEQTVLAVPLRLEMTNGWNLELTLSHVDRGFSYRDPDDPGGFTSSDTQADSDGVRVASHHRLGRHALTWGGEWRGDSVTDGSSFGVNLEDRSVHVSSGFVQDSWAAGHGVHLVAGARWDEADEWGSQVSPRAGVAWRVAPGWGVFAAYGEAFRQPSVGELYYPMSGNPDLAPESSRSWEVGIRRQCRRFELEWELHLFRTDIDHLIQFDYASFAFANVAEARITGAELGLVRKISGDVSGRVALTWLGTKDDQGQQLLRRPEWSGSATVSGGFLETVRGDLTVRWVGPRDDVDPVTLSRLGAGGYLTADLALAWKAMEGFELTARIVNLGDRRYQEVLGYPAPCRRLMVGVRLQAD